MAVLKKNYLSINSSTTMAVHSVAVLNDNTWCLPHSFWVKTLKKKG